MVASIPERPTRRTEVGETFAVIRTPSHFISYAQRSSWSARGSRPATASIGRRSVIRSSPARVGATEAAQRLLPFQPGRPQHVDGVPRQLRLEVEAGLAVPEPLRCDGVQIALAEQDVVVASDLDLGPVRRVEQNAVPDLDGADIAAYGDHPGPGEPPANGGGGWDDDAGRRTPPPRLTRPCPPQPVVQHPPGQLFPR